MKAVACLAVLLASSSLVQHARAQADPALLANVDTCVACHGADGISVGAGLPNLAGQKAAYLRSQLAAFKSGSRTNPLMNAIAAKLSDAEIEALAGFYGSLPGATDPAATSELAPQLVRADFPFPEGYETSFTNYLVTSFPAPRNQLRRYFANETALAAARADQPLPDGSYLLIEIYGVVPGPDGQPTRGADGEFVPGDLISINVMSREAGWGDAVPALLRNENWNYASFRPDRTVNTGANQATCLACHVPLTDASYAFTFEELTAAAKGN
jgi:hemoglobin